MYITETLYWLYKPMRRKFLFDTSRELNKLYHKPRILIMLDMIYCSLFYGAMFTEYGDLGFYHRTHRNRRTYLTTFYNFDLYNKVNDKNSRNLFHDKLLFLNRFSRYIKRRWLNLDTCSDADINHFLDGVKSVVFKASYGDSGKEVEVVDIPNNCTAQYVREKAKKSHFNLIEECVTNHPDIAIFNHDSLNTLRIVSMRKGNLVKILFAGLRVGAKGARIDNISQGGSVARVDIETGRINSGFYTKASSGAPASNNDCLSAMGKTIPYWTECLELVRNMALEVSNIRFIAWDVAVLPPPIGPEVIEANESFGSVIMQLYNAPDEEGLKPIVETFFRE